MPVLDKLISSIKDKQAQFDRTGVYYNTEAYDPCTNKWTTNLIPNPTMRKVMREHARELKRPFILYDTWWQRDWSKPDSLPTMRFVRFQVPRRKYLAPVVAPLLLIAEKRHDAQVVYHPSATLWVFDFKDSTVIDDYIANAMHVDPEMRKALRLPQE